MNSDPQKFRALLDDVLPSAGEHCGPSRAEVLWMLRNERQRRRYRHTGAALLVLIAVGFVSLRWHRQPLAVAPIAQAQAKSAVVIHRVNDEQLLSLLEGMPTALMKLPNGNSMLFVIKP